MDTSEKFEVESEIKITMISIEIITLLIYSWILNSRIIIWIWRGINVNTHYSNTDIRKGKENIVEQLKPKKINIKEEPPDKRT